MKHFELTITRLNGTRLSSYDKIEADDLVELMSKLLLIVVRIQDDIQQEQISRLRFEGNDDNIPF